jgi:hypothetical protein
MYIVAHGNHLVVVAALRWWGAGSCLDARCWRRWGCPRHGVCVGRFAAVVFVFFIGFSAFIQWWWQGEELGTQRRAARPLLSSAAFTFRAALLLLLLIWPAMVTRRWVQACGGLPELGRALRSLWSFFSLQHSPSDCDKLSPLSRAKGVATPCSATTVARALLSSSRGSSI